MDEKKALTKWEERACVENKIISLLYSVDQVIFFTETEVLMKCCVDSLSKSADCIICCAEEKYVYGQVLRQLAAFSICLEEVQPLL